jgi:hypothetical protein
MRLTDLYGLNLTCNQRSLLEYPPPSYDHWCITDRYVLNHTRIIESGTYTLVANCEG